MCPSEVILEPDRLRLRWEDGLRSTFSFAELRRQCRCSHCHAARLKQGELNSSLSIEIRRLSPIGHYGMQLHFSDGHERGIYPWAFLRELSQQGGPRSCQIPNRLNI